MMGDLVKRLRVGAPTTGGTLSQQAADTIDFLADISEEAADEIERLRAALEHVMQDDGLIPRATSDCRKVVAAALSPPKETLK